MKLDLDGKVLGKFGKGGKEPGAFDTIHAIDCPSENEVLIGDFSWRAYKVTLKPVR